MPSLFCRPMNARNSPIPPAGSSRHGGVERVCGVEGFCCSPRARPGQQAATGWEPSKCVAFWSGAGDAAAAGCWLLVGCCCRLVASAPCWLLLMAAGGPCTRCRTCCGQHDRLWHQADQPAPHACEANDDEDPALNEHSSKRLLVGDLCVGGSGRVKAAPKQHHVVNLLERRRPCAEDRSAGLGLVQRSATLAYPLKGGTPPGSSPASAGGGCPPCPYRGSQRQCMQSRR